MMGPPKITTVAGRLRRRVSCSAGSGGYEWTNRIGLVGHRVNHSTVQSIDGSASLPSTEATTGLSLAGSARQGFRILKRRHRPKGAALYIRSI